MKIKSEFLFSDNGFEVKTISPETPLNELSEKAIQFGLKVGAIVKPVENKAKKAPLSKRVK